MLAMTHQYCALYRARNLANGKEYYGISVNPKKRWNEHKNTAARGCDQAFGRAIKKHGADAFEFSVLMEERGDDAVAKCKDAETLVIAMANSQVPHGYNITAGGEGLAGYAHTEETKKKISASHTGKVRSPEHRENAGKVRRGRKHSDEHRAKISAAGMGRTPSAETRLKLSMAQKGRPRKPASAETRAKMSAARKGVKQKPRSAEACLNMSKALKGRKFSEDWKRKIGDGLRGKTRGACPDDVKAKISASLKGATIPDDVRAKIGAAITGKRWVNNGVTQLFIAKGEATPDGFVGGMLKRPKTNKSLEKEMA
jgi:group I intron endonuclease